MRDRLAGQGYTEEMIDRRIEELEAKRAELYRQAGVDRRV
jgi:hypothetical protein